MRGTIAPSPEKSRTDRPMVCAARAHDAARFPLSRTPSPVLAEHFGVSPSRARRLRAEGPENPVSIFLGLVEDPDVRNAPDYVASALEALERRYIREAQANPQALRARLVVLMSEEHTVEAGQNRALQSEQGVDDALLTHASKLIEIVAIRRALGMEDA